MGNILTKRLAAVALASASVFALATPTLAIAQEARRSYSIPTQDLASALEQFGRQSGKSVMFDRARVAGARSKAIAGTIAPEAALRRLLQGTGFTMRSANSSTFVIEEAAPRARVAPTGANRQTAPSSGKVSPGTGGARTVSSSGDESAETSEIIVTAQKREERLKEVPISISVVTGRALDGSTVEGVTEALSRVPGVSTTVAYQGGNTFLTVRGVGASGPIYNGASPIGYYLDGAPFGLVKSTLAPDSSAFDLDRIEVLRGPQGTLYGASALNGVVRIFTKDADLNTFEGKMRGSVSGTETGGTNYRGDLAINVPLIEDKLAVRLVGGYQNLSGWIDRPSHKDANDAEIGNIRLKVDSKPTDRLSVGASVWLSRSNFGAMSVSGPNGRRESIVEEPLSSDFDSYSLRFTYEADAFSVSSVTSYLKYYNKGYLDLRPQGTSATLFTSIDAKMFSEEVVINSTGNGPWEWSVGGIYRDGNDTINQAFQPTLIYDASDISRSFAVFGQVSRKLIDDRLKITGGLRYFHDNVIGRENTKTDGTTNPLIRSNSTFEKVSPRLALDWKLNQDAMIYASYSEGFRSGFNQATYVVSNNPDFPPAKADNLRNYEVGFKGSAVNNRVYFEAALYYLDWQDVQQTLTLPYGPAGNVTATVNGQSASGIGADLALTVRATDRLSLNGTLSWNDLKMDADVFSEGVVLFAKGERLSFSPEYTASGSVDYAFPLGEGYEGKLSSSINYTSGQVWRNIIGGVRINAPGDKMTVARANFSVTSPDGWTATAFVDNLSNEKGFPYRSPYGGFTDARIRPRTAGVQLEYRW